MKPVPNAGGQSTNWLNFNTGIRAIGFTMDADKYHASIAIQIKHPNEFDRLQYYHQLLHLKTFLENETGYKWDWQPNLVTTNGNTISRISQEIRNVNVLNKNDWPTIIAFLKPRMMALAKLWETIKDGFE